MIGTLDIKCFAAKPQMPLQPMFAFAGSPSSIRVMDVPRKVGDWEITGVKVVVTYPDNRTLEKSAVRTGSVWVATLEGSETAGKVGEGFSVVADGVDEDGNEVTGYVLGKGDVFILENRNDIKSLVDKIAVRFLEDMPTNPAAGDMIEFNGVLKFYDGEKWVSVSTPTKLSQLENDVGYITESAIPSDVSAFNNDVGYITAEAIPSKVSEFENDAGYVTASAIPSKVSELENDVGYLTASSTEFTNKRDYDDLTFPMPSDVTVKPFVNAYDNKRWARAYVQKFDVTYDGVGHELSEFIIHHEYGMMWYKASTLFMTTRDGETFYLRDNNTNIMATTTIYALKSGVVDFTYDGKSGSITLFAREKTNFALDYQTINGNLMLKANGTTVGIFDPQNPIESEINIPVPSNVSQLNNDADYMSAQAVSASYYSKGETNTLLSAKQNALSNSQLTALNYTTDELQTVVTYSDNTTVAYNIYGQIERGDIAVDGKTISSIKIGKGVTSLGLALFLNDKTTLTSATIPDTVTYIGIGAFDGCANLVSIEIPESVTSVGDRAFRGCTSLQTAKVKMTGPTNTNMFYGCTSLQNLEIGNGVTSIAADAFHGCTSLTSVTIPDSVRAIGNQAFNACTGLVKVDTGNGVTRISERAFRECTNLEEVNIGDSVTTIDQSAFAVCPSLEKVTVGESVATISYNAFSGSTSALTEVLFKEKTLAEVQAMGNYPWGISTSVIKTWNDASEEYVDSRIGEIDTALDSINGEII